MYRLKRRHDYYYQIQCQLYCVNREWWDFVLRTDKDLHIQQVIRDRTWWKVQLPKLHKFYFDALLPELACPRYGKGEIRDHPALTDSTLTCFCNSVFYSELRSFVQVLH